MMLTSSRINLGFACVTSNNPMTIMIALAEKHCNPFLSFFLRFCFFLLKFKRATVDSETSAYKICTLFPQLSYKITHTFAESFVYTGK